jgi:hypothetical protein
MLRTRSLEFYNRGYAAYIYIYIHVDLHMSAAVFGWKVASSKQVVGMANRSKQTINLVKLKEIGKEFLPDPNTDYYLSDDVNVVVSYHCKFFKAVALHTKRLNPVSLSQLGKDLFKLQKRESEQYGDSLASAFSYCMTAGSKAVTGSKLCPNVLSVYKAAGKDGQVKKDGVKAEVKEEGLSSKRESSSPPPRPSKTLKPCLSSPSQIASLYACRSVHVKAIPHADTPRRHSKQKWPPHICIYIYIYAIYTLVGGTAKCLLRVSYLQKNPVQAEPREKDVAPMPKMEPMGSLYAFSSSSHDQVIPETYTARSHRKKCLLDICACIHI